MAATPPALRREYAVELTCGACASAVREALQALPEVQAVEVYLDTSTVLVTGDVPIDSVLSAIQTTGRVAALVGTGSALDAALRRAVPKEVGPPEENTAAVAEFKGHAYGHGAVHGVLRLVQLTGAHVGVRHGRVWVEEVSDTNWSDLVSGLIESSARADLSLNGLPPRTSFCMAVHTSGNTSRGADSTGPPFAFRPDGEGDDSPGVGCLLSATTGASGCTTAAALAVGLRVWSVIGRSAVLHVGGAGMPDSDGSARVAAAVLARSASVGANASKRVCACDGTVLWDISKLKTDKPPTKKVRRSATAAAAPAAAPDDPSSRIEASASVGKITWAEYIKKVEKHGPLGN
jgi:copper chaperone for superoxide dismutase